jgi:NAD(P)H-quinone oxidoreductase subunit 4L
MTAPGLVPYLLVGVALFGIGVAGILSQRSALMVMMSIEVVMNAAILTLVAFWRFVRPDRFDGQVFAIIAVTIGAAEMAAGIGLLLLLFRQRGSVNIDVARELKG